MVDRCAGEGIALYFGNGGGDADFADVGAAEGILADGLETFGEDDA